MSARAASLVQRDQEIRPAPPAEPPASRLDVQGTEAQQRARARAARPAQPVVIDHGVLHGRGMRIVLLAALVLTLAAVCAAAGWAVRVAATSEDPPPPRPAHVVVLGPASLRTPAGWAPERLAAARVPGLEAGGAAFAPTPGLDAHVVLALLPRDDPSLIAAPLRELLGPIGRPRRRTVAGLEAWSYPPRSISGGRTAEVTVAQTPAGVVTVACIADSAAWVGAAGCADDLGRGAPPAAAPVEPAQPAAMPGDAAKALERLGAARTTLRAELAGAKKRRDQRRLALQLARAHETAAAVLAGAASLRGLVRTLGSAARLYRRLAHAAAAGRPAAFGRARAAITRTDRALEQGARRAR